MTEEVIQMASNSNQASKQDEENDAEDILTADDAAEVIEEEDDGDVHMDSDDDHPSNSVPNPEDENEDTTEIDLVNDSVAHFSGHKDSIFCIAQHPLRPEIVVTGGGDDVAYVFDATPPERPVLPASYASDPQQQLQLQERKSLEALAKLDGHLDSVSAVMFTLQNGEYVITAGLDGRVRAWKESGGGEKRGREWEFVAQAEEETGDINGSPRVRP